MCISKPRHLRGLPPWPTTSAQASNRTAGHHSSTLPYPTGPRWDGGPAGGLIELEVSSLDRFHLIIPEIGLLFSGNRVSEFLLPFNHLYQACLGPGLREVPVDTYQLSGSRKICISFGNLEDENGKIESWRNTYRGVDLKKMRFVQGGFSCTNSPTSCTWQKVVDGYKRNIVSLPKQHIRIRRVFATLMRPIVRNTQCDPLVLTTPVGATHCFLQHLQFYRNPTD